LNITMHLLDNSWSKEHTPSMVSKSLFYYLQSAGHFKNGSEYCTRRSDYDSMLLIYTIDGFGTLSYRNQVYSLSPGTVCIIDCREEQVYGTDSKQKADSGSTGREVSGSARSTSEENIWIFDWIHFNGSESRGYVHQILNNTGPVIPIDSSSQIPEHISQIHRLLLDNDECIDIRASCLLIQILTELLLTVSSRKNDGGIPSTIQKAVSIIENRYQKPIALDELAEELCISKFYLSRQFKLYTGYSPNEYLIKYRLSQGKAMLKETALPVYEIAQRVGFENASHFIQTFKKHENITPLKFRKYWR
jgi:AraC-like DNA-binding protein